MQRISRAPELSATFSRLSCWIIGCLLRLLEDLGLTPVLGLRHRAGLDEPHRVTGAGLVPLVVGVVHLRAPDHLLVGRVTAGALDPDGDRLVHLVGDDDALTDLRAPGLERGRLGAGPRALAGGLGAGSAAALAVAAALAGLAAA